MRVGWRSLGLDGFEKHGSQSRGTRAVGMFEESTGGASGTPVGLILQVRRDAPYELLMCCEEHGSQSRGTPFSCYLMNDVMHAGD